MPTELLVDFNEFWSRLRVDIAAAQDSVFVQTFAFEGDAVGKQLAGALLSSRASDRRVLADSFTRIVLSDRFRYSPANFFDPKLRQESRETADLIRELTGAGVQIRFTNPWAVSPRQLLSRNHKKLILVDDRVAYIGGINFSEHNAAWHDMMLRIDDPAVVEFLDEDFVSTWNGTKGASRRCGRKMEVLSADGRNNGEAFARVMELIDSARRAIFVESPYVTFPFYERLRAATRRGVNVTIITPEQNNWRLFANYARLESARSGIDLRLFQRGMSHLKAMLIDDEYLIAGSSNFDYLSYRIHQELIGVITDREVINDFRTRVVLPDLAHSRPIESQAGSFSKHWEGLQSRVLAAATTILT